MRKTSMLLLLLSSLFFTIFSTAQEQCDRYGCWRRLYGENYIEFCKTGITRQNNGSFYCLENMSNETFQNIMEILFISKYRRNNRNFESYDPIFVEWAFQYEKNTRDDLDKIFERSREAFRGLLD